ncbi:MAG TPA: SGNH/GDSL hydrolase family protein [Elainellaceae cyanobacterium]
MKFLLILGAIAIGIVIVLEVALRQLFGFGSPLLYIADDHVGYLLSPNQRTRRFGNQIAINAYSMRSPEISRDRPDSTLRILLLGDSIANGGWWTDQSQTIAALMAEQLRKELSEMSFAEVEVLNASANSWGPRNELAYLQKFGCFQAHIIVLLINTDDLFAIAPNSVQVGRDRNYPSQKPPFALAEVYSRYLSKTKPIPELQALQDERGDRVGLNLEAIRQIQIITHDSQAQLLLAMTPLKREIGDPGSRDYEIKARQRLAELTHEYQIPYIDLLPLLNAHSNSESLYWDHIHLNSDGNEWLSEILVTQLSSNTSRLNDSTSGFA